jgi:hypothetical protein
MLRMDVALWSDPVNINGEIRSDLMAINLGKGHISVQYFFIRTR